MNSFPTTTPTELGVVDGCVPTGVPGIHLMRRLISTGTTQYLLRSPTFQADHAGSIPVTRSQAFR